MTPVQARALVGFFLRRSLTRGRATGLVALNAVALVAAIAIGRGVPSEDRLDAAINFAAFFGLGLMIPIVALVLASSTLGDLIDDETLVYLWHRPLPRWALALTAWGAAVLVAVPTTALPLGVWTTLAAPGETDGNGPGPATVLAVTVTAATLAVVAYTGLFTLLGVWVRRSLIWGLIYLFIWESFVARAGDGAARLSVGSYPRSLLARYSDIDLPMADRLTAAAVLVPLVVGFVGILFTARRLDRMDVA